MPVNNTPIADNPNKQGASTPAGVLAKNGSKEQAAAAMTPQATDNRIKSAIKQRVPSLAPAAKREDSLSYQQRTKKAPDASEQMLQDAKNTILSNEAFSKLGDMLSLIHI